MAEHKKRFLLSILLTAVVTCLVTVVIVRTAQTQTSLGVAVPTRVSAAPRQATPERDAQAQTQATYAVCGPGLDQTQTPSPSARCNCGSLRVIIDQSGPCTVTSTTGSCSTVSNASPLVRCCLCGQ